MKLTDQEVNKIKGGEFYADENNWLYNLGENK